MQGGKHSPCTLCSCAGSPAQIVIFVLPCLCKQMDAGPFVAITAELLFGAFEK